MRLATCLVFVLAGCTAAIAEDGYAGKLKGAYEIWEDFEGGKVCPLALDDEQSIGGFALEGDDQCMEPFKLTGDPNAWFLDDEGWLVLIDAARQTLVRFRPDEKGGFYADRTADRLESLNLTPAS